MVGEWSGYLGRFHEERAGITEKVLGRSFDGGQNPYEWLAGVVADGPVVDVACGSAPLHSLVCDLGYFGVDLAAEELRLARRRGVNVVEAPAHALPNDDRSAGTVVCSMALQVVGELQQVLGEVGRVLRPGGRFVAIVPERGPLRVRDWLPVAGLLAALGRAPTYPNDGVLRRTSELFGAAGLTLVGDQRRRFSFRFGDAGDVDLFLDSLYVPGISPRRLRSARRWLRLCARAGAEIPIPVRRLIATR